MNKKYISKTFIKSWTTTHQTERALSTGQLNPMPLPVSIVASLLNVDVVTTP